MIRLFALTALLSGFAAFAQAQPEEQQCLTKCGEAMSACMLPCLGSEPKDAAKPENKTKTMACVKVCSEAQKPCISDCKTKGQKK